MVELVDTQDLKSCDLKSRAGSIPALSTSQQNSLQIIPEAVLFTDTFISAASSVTEHISTDKFIDN